VIFVLQKNHFELFLNNEGRVGHVVTTFTLVAVKLAMIGLSRKIIQGCKVISSPDKKKQKNALQQFTFNCNNVFSEALRAVTTYPTPGHVVTVVGACCHNFFNFSSEIIYMQ